MRRILRILEAARLLRAYVERRVRVLLLGAGGGATSLSWAGSSCSSAAGSVAYSAPGSAGSEVYSDVGCSSDTFGAVLDASSVSEPSCAGDAAGTSGGDPALGVSAAPALSPLF